MHADGYRDFRLKRSLGFSRYLATRGLPIVRSPEVDRRRLFAFVDKLAEELGPADEAEVAKYSEMFAASAATARARQAAH